MNDSPTRFSLPHVPHIEPAALRRMWQVMDEKTKPPRSLGRLEELAVRFGALRGAVLPLDARASVVVAAADHGVADEQVSAYPQEVTRQMLFNFEAGGAAINALCKAAGADLLVIDVGTRTFPAKSAADEAEPQTKRVAIASNPIRHCRIRSGSGNFTRQVALELEEVQQAVQFGLTVSHELEQRRVTIVGLGEMGIANTTVAAALTAVFCRVTSEAERALLVGRGTGVDDAGLARKRAAIERALALHQPDPADPWRVMTQIGGLEIAFLAGLAIGAASHRMAVVLDGFISTAAGLVAEAWCPDIRPYLFASHRSVEPGHGLALQKLDLAPYLNLELRLGEGSGAALLLPMFTAAANIVNQMATFDSAEVSRQAP